MVQCDTVIVCITERCKYHTFSNRCRYPPVTKVASSNDPFNLFTPISMAFLKQFYPNSKINLQFVYE